MARNASDYMPWEKRYDETDILERAMRAFWARGYEATSMNDLVGATGINRGSIYAAYASKHGLFMKALEHYDRVYRRDFLERIANDHAPGDAILAAFDAAAGQIGTGDTPGGCLLVNSALELSPHDGEVREFVDRRLAEVEAFFARAIDAAQRDGSLRRDLDPRQTAMALLGLFVGLRVLARSGARGATLQAITAQARTMLA